MLLQPVMAGFPGGPQTKRKNKKNKTVQTSIRYCRRAMTLYRTIKKLIMIMSHTICCNTIKSHNTVHARTTLLKAAELVSSFSSDGSYRSSNNSTNMIPGGDLRLVFAVNLLLIGRILQAISHWHWYVVHTHKCTTNYINVLHWNNMQVVLAKIVGLVPYLLVLRGLWRYLPQVT